jgi:hypothetical protein
VQQTLGVVLFGTSPSLIHYSEAPFKGTPKNYGPIMVRQFFLSVLKLLGATRVA